MVNIKIDFTWKQWIAVIGSVIIFSAIAYCLIKNDNRTMNSVENISGKSIEIK